MIILGEVLWGASKAIISLLGADYSGFSVALPIGLGAAAIAFALWWSYFQIPCGQIIERHFIFASIAAIGISLELIAAGANTYYFHTGNHHAVTPLFAITTLSICV